MWLPSTPPAEKQFWSWLSCFKEDLFQTKWKHFLSLKCKEKEASDNSAERHQWPLLWQNFSFPTSSGTQKIMGKQQDCTEINTAWKIFGFVVTLRLGLGAIRFPKGLGSSAPQICLGKIIFNGNFPVSMGKSYFCCTLMFWATLNTTKALWSVVAPAPLAIIITSVKLCFKWKHNYYP